ncbi:MAG TPA: diguanylate cyclase [Candidatus Polarisedimenticolia bacterium]|nr:diguanylate cyclase [Candidatus Polarisedimenticolia bacterium]
MAGRSGAPKKKRAQAAAARAPAATAPVPTGESAWNPRLVESLYDLLYHSELVSHDLDSDLRKIERKHGEGVYSELIYMLSHLRFEPGEAKSCWQRILEHQVSMRRRLGTEVDLRVALVSYFVEINRMLRNPKVIELKVFEQTQASAYRDELTGLCNFRYFREYLAREILSGERYNRPLSLVMVDIDDFKTYNDHNGHEAGNRSLATIGSLLADSLRKIDIAARYGGEEFALILPSTSKTGAHEVAERARRKIEKHRFPNEQSQPGGSLTISLGVATYPADARNATDLVRRADSALYVAKTRGKNQVHLYGQNRRSYRRVDARIGGRFCMLAAEYHALTTVNLSEGGLLFIADRRLPAGSLIDISLSLPATPREVTASGRVVRVEHKEDGQFEAAIRIIDISTRDQSLLAEYIRAADATRDVSPEDDRDP